ncbi:MAG: hypothetical protein GY765_23200 [bacterium]|nr:hypothetical protein [bacterium]
MNEKKQRVTSAMSFDDSMFYASLRMDFEGMVNSSDLSALRMEIQRMSAEDPFGLLGNFGNSGNSGAGNLGRLDESLLNPPGANHGFPESPAHPNGSVRDCPGLEIFSDCNAEEFRNSPIFSDYNAEELRNSSIFPHYKVGELRDSEIIPHYKAEELSDSVIIPHYKMEELRNSSVNPNCEMADLSESLMDVAPSINDLHKSYSEESVEALGVPGGGIRFFRAYHKTPAGVTHIDAIYFRTHLEWATVINIRRYSVGEPGKTFVFVRRSVPVETLSLQHKYEILLTLSVLAGVWKSLHEMRAMQSDPEPVVMMPCVVSVFVRATVLEVFATVRRSRGPPQMAKYPFICFVPGIVSTSPAVHTYRLRMRKHAPGGAVGLPGGSGGWSLKRPG